MNDTPETEKLWQDFCQSDNTTADAEKLKIALRKLETERDEARVVAWSWRENWRNGASMSLIASSKLPWENAEVSHGDRERQPDTHQTHNQP